MEENERKYQILPGVKLPDYKTLKEASSDFEISGLEDISITAPVTMSDKQATRENLSAEEVKRLMELGSEVAESEERAAEESKRKMQAILQTAVTQSASLEDLKKSAIQHANEEKKAELEQREREEAAKKAEEDEKKRMREERRAMQKANLDAVIAKKAAAAEAAAAEAAESAESAETATEEAATEVVEGIATEETATEETAPVAAKTEEPSGDEEIIPETDIDSTGVIVSDEQTFEDFGEFLDEGNNN